MNENQRKKINARSGLPNPLHVCGYGSVPRVRYLAMSIQAERIRQLGSVDISAQLDNQEGAQTPDPS